MTAAITRPAEPPADRPIAVLPAPVREPPFDDERPARHLTVVGPHDRPLPFAAPSPLRLTERRDQFGARPTERGELPAPDLFLRRLLVAVFEALAGRRSLHQLAPHLSRSVYSGLVADLDRPGRSRGWQQHRAVIRSVRLSEPADGVIEAAAVLQHGPRVRAVALRAEGLDGRWRCVRLHIG